MKYRIAAAILTACLLSPALALAEKEVIDGVPYYKVMSRIDKTDWFEMNVYEGLQVRLLIKEKDGEYIWATRGGKKLIYSGADGFATFVEPGGTGYIRITKEKNKCIYMEHVTYEMQNLTYWGEAEDCALPKK